MNFDCYINYINNTNLEPLPVSAFVEDWEPVGQGVLNRMVQADLIQIRGNGIYLRPDLVSRENLMRRTALLAAAKELQHE